MKRISIVSLIALIAYAVLIYVFVVPADISHNTPFEFTYSLETPGIYKQTCTFNHRDSLKIIEHDIHWNKNNPNYTPKEWCVDLSEQEKDRLKASIFESMYLEPLKPHYGFDGKAASAFVHSFSLITQTDTVFLSVKDNLNNDIPKEVYTLVGVLRDILQKHSSN